MRKITIKISNDDYEIESGDISGFELLGILEQVIFDIKTTAKRREDEKPKEGIEIRTEELPQTEPQPETKASSENTENADKPSDSSSTISAVSQVSNIRQRIGNAVKAVRDLGGQVGNIDLKTMTDDELQTELEELTSQYKRLKTAKKAKS